MFVETPLPPTLALNPIADANIVPRPSHSVSLESSRSQQDKADAGVIGFAIAF
jgi:hypothetical protein